MEVGPEKCDDDRLLDQMSMNVSRHSLEGKSILLLIFYYETVTEKTYCHYEPYHKLLLS